MRISIARYNQNGSVRVKHFTSGGSFRFATLGAALRCLLRCRPLGGLGGHPPGMDSRWPWGDPRGGGPSRRFLLIGVGWSRRRGAAISATGGTGRIKREVRLMSKFWSGVRRPSELMSSRRGERLAVDADSGREPKGRATWLQTGLNDSPSPNVSGSSRITPLTSKCSKLSTKQNGLAAVLKRQVDELPGQGRLGHVREVRRNRQGDCPVPGDSAFDKRPAHR